MRMSHIGIVVLLLTIVACGGGGTTPVEPTPPAATVTVVGSFADDEIRRFEQAMQPFEESTGIKVVYESTRDVEARITEGLATGDLPDMAGFPQPGALMNVAPHAIDITTMVPMNRLREHYGQSWIDMATVDGKTVGIWHRVTVKSLVWYPPVAFADAGYTIPETWDDLITLSDQMVRDGHTPWYAPMESGPATGWVGTDWIEDILLRTVPVETYDQWVTGELPFNSPEVRRAFELMGDILLHEDYVLEGPESIVTVSFLDSGKPLLTDPPEAWMVRQGNALPTWIEPVPTVGPNADLDYFYFPPIDPMIGRPVLVAGDVYVVFDDRPEVQALVEYMISAKSLESWIKEGGILSPHKDVHMSWYSPADRGVAEILQNASIIRFDGSDLMPSVVGAGTFWQGVVDYLKGEDLDTVLTRIDESWPHDSE